MCFPGGRLEGAESPEECALRETWEELGIPREKIRILGRLDFVAHRANFILHPVLALVEEEAVDGLHLNPDEVAEVFQVPLEHLRNEPPLEYHYDLIPRPDENFPYELIGIPRDYRWQIGGEDVPIYLWKGHIIWGLTGRITRHLVSLIQESGGETWGPEAAACSCCCPAGPPDWICMVWSWIPRPPGPPGII